MAASPPEGARIRRLCPMKSLSVDPDEDPAAGIPYEKQKNLKPESKAAVDEFLFTTKAPEGWNPRVTCKAGAKLVSGLQADVRLWHLADLNSEARDVCFRV